MRLNDAPVGYAIDLNWWRFDLRVAEISGMTGLLDYLQLLSGPDQVQ